MTVTMILSDESDDADDTVVAMVWMIA